MGGGLIYWGLNFDMFWFMESFMGLVLVNYVIFVIKRRLIIDKGVIFVKVCYREKKL